MSGILSGIAAAVFLILLEWATNFRNTNPLIIWALPIAGLFIGWIYYRYGKDVAGGHNLILDEIHDPKKVLPLKMAPFVLTGTLLTHLFGGSAGREGTAVQMGASLSDQLTKFFKITPEERKILLVAGAGAGFGAAIGAPWAGTIFGMEVINVGKFRLTALFQCLIASFVGYYTTILLKAPHSLYPHFEIPRVNLKTVACVLLAGIIFGIASKVFTMTTHFIEKLNSRFISLAPLRPFVAGILIVSLYYIEGSYKYVGLGIPYIQEGLLQPQGFREPLLKTLFTAMTVGSGFKGGEFIPLVFIGTTLGSALSILIPISFHLLSGLGFAAVFAGAANTPLACSLMAMEIFGLNIAPYAIIACFASYFFSGHHGIYGAQRIVKKKHQRLIELLKRMKPLSRKLVLTFTPSSGMNDWIYWLKAWRIPMANENKTYELRVEKTISKPPVEVFRAIGEGRLFLNCSADSESLKIDFRVGGKYTLNFLGHNMKNQGEFLEVIPHSKIAFTWCQDYSENCNPDTKVLIEFKDFGGKTALTLTHTGFTDLENKNAHEGGWNNGLDDLGQEMVSGKLRLMRKASMPVEKLFEAFKNTKSFFEGIVLEAIPHEKMVLSGPQGSKVTLGFEADDDKSSSWLEIVHEGLKTEFEQKTQRAAWDSRMKKLN